MGTVCFRPVWMPPKRSEGNPWAMRNVVPRPPTAQPNERPTPIYSIESIRIMKMMMRQAEQMKGRGGLGEFGSLCLTESPDSTLSCPVSIAPRFLAGTTQRRAVCLYSPLDPPCLWCVSMAIDFRAQKSPAGQAGPKTNRVKQYLGPGKPATQRSEAKERAAKQHDDRTALGD